MLSPPRPFRRPEGVGRNVVVLGLVSLFTDASSEMLYPVMPLYLTAVLHAPMSVVGLIEGLAESVASLLKALSGRLADRVRRRPLVVAGYVLAAASRPLLLAADTWPRVLAVRLIDRTGKGVRGPARDAMIAASTPSRHRGVAFGLHRAMDTLGAVVGPAVGVALLALGFGYRGVFLAACVPALAAVATLAALTPEPVRPAPTASTASAPLPAPLRRVLGVIALFSIGNSSNAFLLLRARDLGYSDSAVIGLYVLYNAVYAAAATSAGRLSDVIGRRRVLVFGWTVFALVYTGFALAPARWLVVPLLAGYGVYAAATGGTMRAYVADLADPRARGSALGAQQMVTGLLALAASTLAGALWSRYGPAAPFLLGAATAATAAGLLHLACPDPDALDEPPSSAG